MSNRSQRSGQGLLQPQGSLGRSGHVFRFRPGGLRCRVALKCEQPLALKPDEVWRGTDLLGQRILPKARTKLSDTSSPLTSM